MMCPKTSYPLIYYVGEVIKYFLFDNLMRITMKCYIYNSLQKANISYLISNLRHFYSKVCLSCLSKLTRIVELVYFIQNYKWSKLRGSKIKLELWTGECEVAWRCLRCVFVMGVGYFVAMVETVFTLTILSIFMQKSSLFRSMEDGAIVFL